MNEVNRIGGVVEFTIDALRPPPRHSFACTFGAVYFVPPLLARRGILLTHPQKVYSLIS